MKSEVLTGEDAETARLAFCKLQVWWHEKGEWRDRDLPDMECDPYALYRIKPEPPKKRRVPLADLRVLAGAMLVWPDGSYTSICEIQPDGQALGAKGVIDCVAFTADQLTKGYHYDRGNGPVPCWTEVEE